MAFDSLDRLLKSLEQQPGWAEYQRYCRLCQYWDKIIDSNVAPHTRPLYVQRNLLWVATSSAVWAQHLSLQRYSLLEKINTQFPREPLVNIRFSSAQWHDSPLFTGTPLESSHPSEIALPNPPPQTSPEQLATTPEAAFQRWTELIKARSQGLPLCPQCHCPTPPGELKRWSLCMHCATQQWQKNSPSPQ